MVGTVRWVVRLGARHALLLRCAKVHGVVAKGEPSAAMALSSALSTASPVPRNLQKL